MKLFTDYNVRNYLNRILVAVLLTAMWCQAQETVTVKVTPEELAVLKALRERKEARKRLRERQLALKGGQGAAASAPASEAAAGPAPVEDVPLVQNKIFSAGKRLKFTETLQRQRVSDLDNVNALVKSLDGSALSEVIEVSRTPLTDSPEGVSAGEAAGASLAAAIDVSQEAAELGPIAETFRLRQSWDPAKLFKFNRKKQVWEEDESNGLSSDGAEFTWTRNNVTTTDVWTARGVAFFPILLNPYSTPVKHVVLVPSIEFNRDTSTDGTSDELNSLIARLGVDLNFVNFLGPKFPGLAKGYVVRAAVGYQTDFEFESGQTFTEFQMEKIDEVQGLGVFSPREDALDEDRKAAAPAVAERQFLGIKELPRKITLAPIFSLASIQSIADKKSLEDLKAMEYGTVGFKVGLDYELELLKHWEPLAALSTTKIGVEYRMWWAISGNATQGYDYLDAHVIFPFVGLKDRLSLKAFYRVGEMPLTLEHVDMVGVALTAKF